MTECPYCGEFVNGDPDEIGARCPRCREPLYERAGGPRLADEPGAPPSRGTCTVHPGNVAAGTCQRCGNFVCRVCRTRWEDRDLCLACVERLARERERGPQDARAHRRQAGWALACGLAAWGAVLGGLALLGLAGSSRAAAGAALFGGLLVAASFLPAFFGVGQGAAAARARGDRMVVATSGLVLSASHLGIMSGLFLLALWRL
jgi:hypothetical protein